MSVSDVPRERQQVPGIVTTNFVEWLRSCPYDDTTAVLEGEDIPVAQQCRVLEVEQESDATVGNEGEPATVPVRLVERDSVIHAVAPTRAVRAVRGVRAVPAVRGVRAYENVDRAGVTTFDGPAADESVHQNRK